ncbi:unnamed protein product [Hermetia illucens]|uniref:Uncharacterized protein n=1 Tax=Hermetia illucens TaxID=343691 RepID=A0A7R8V509_HERIL|nr:unnamed protein product [Hermetia illucens]
MDVANHNLGSTWTHLKLSRLWKISRLFEGSKEMRTIPPVDSRRDYGSNPVPHKVQKKFVKGSIIFKATKRVPRNPHASAEGSFQTDTSKVNL